MSSFPPELPAGFDRPFVSGREPAVAPGTAAAPARHPERPAQAVTRQWQALHRAAAAVATLGGVPAETPAPRIVGFPDRFDALEGWRAGLVRQGVADLAAVMEPGLSALIAVHGKGADPAPAARALLQEFVEARDALLGLADGEAH